MSYGNEGGFRREGGFGGGFRPRGNFGGPREMHDVRCTSCGVTTKVPFKPIEGRPVFCRDCYFKRNCDPAPEAEPPLQEPVTFEIAGVVAAEGLELPAETTSYQQLIIDIEEVNEELLQRLRTSPELMRTLEPRKFEELVAELLTRLGYTVELTPPSKDGGYDIAAARRDDVGSFLYLVECKRYAPPHKVGVELVRSLYGVVEERGASGGVLVTTSFFTRGACELQRELEGRMNLRDYTALQEWLAKTRSH